MWTMLEIIGMFALIQGTVGLVHKFTGWLGWGLVERVPFLDGHEVYGSIALVVLAFALFAAAESQKKA
ncbi:hypothetical protein GTY65_22065 [Streptomyces sp. SID8379]|nr:hypothetical protein [Streptomyces sp. SID8379]MYW66730.1 hypothetical protein [Streptomyces sp. SID8379]